MLYEAALRARVILPVARPFCVRSSGPTLKYAFSWNGTLMSLPTEFLRDLGQIFRTQFRMGARDRQDPGSYKPVFNDWGTVPSSAGRRMRTFT
jgi:hypothetical protein